jgi:hypothetical protein
LSASLEDKVTVGFAITTIVWVVELTPAAFDTVKETVYEPAAAYVCVGFCWLDVLPSPKVQAHDEGEFVEKSVNVTVEPSQTEFGEVKDAVGGLLDGTE